jgi:cytosine permease
MGAQIPKKKDVFGDYATLPLPEEESRSTLNIFMIYMGVLAVVAAIFAGSGLAQMYDTATMITVALVGNAVLAVFGGLIAYVGGSTRANTYMLLRYPLGRWGSALGSLVVSAIPLIVWFAVETWLFGITVNVIYPNHPLTSIAAASIWGGILMMLTAYYGFKAMAILSYITVPFWYTLVMIGFFAALDLNGGVSQMWSVRPEVIAPLGAGITYVIGLYASGCVITPDVSRYGKKKWAGSLAWGLHVFIFMTLLLFAGGVMTLLTGSPNVIVAIAQLGLGVGALLLAILGQWTTNDNNLWSASLAWVNITGLWNKRVWVVATGVIGTLIAGLWGGLWGMSLDPFINFALMLGYFIPPVGAVLIADFYIFRKYVLGIKESDKRYSFGPGTEYPVVNLPGLISVLAGGLLGWYTSTINFGAPAVNAIVAAFVLYLLLIVPMHKAGIKYELGRWVEKETGF